jgi:periplasmic protein TonB
VRRPRPASVVHPLYYPRLAEEKHIEGFVDFEFTIAPDGSVVDPRITREEPANFGFAQAAAQVFGYWKFPPDIVNGVAVSTPARYRMSFILAK